jgi:hypothetical protein
VVSQYGLRAEDADGALRFEWAQSGAAIPPQEEQAPDEPPATANAAAGLERAREGAQETSRLAAALAKGLDFVARLMPRAWGSGLRQAAGRLRQGQFKLDRIVRAPARIAQRVRATLKLKPRGAEATVVASAVAWSRTAPVSPGASATIELLVEAVRPFQAQQRTLRIYSLAAGHDDLPPVAVEQSFELDGVPLIQRAVPLLALWAGAIVVLWLLFRLLGIGLSA